MVEELRRTVPFLLSQEDSDSSFILLDRFHIDSKTFSTKSDFYTKLTNSLNLDFIGTILSADEAIELVTEQYQVCLEYIYSHKVWEILRSGKSSQALYAYLIETRHYLAAAASRMAPSIGTGIGVSPLAFLLSRHMLEEYDHSIFFEKALSILGCPLELVISSRPAPATTEWIHLTRAIASQDELVAMICSGLKEFSAADIISVRSWHEMLITKKLLPREAVEAIFEHVETDIGYGHTNNWETAIRYEAPIPTKKLCDALNAVTVSAEMIYRWCDSLVNGLSGDIVEIMPKLQLTGENTQTNPQTIDRTFDGLPVWPANILHLISQSNNEPENVRKVVATAYCLSDHTLSSNHKIDITQDALVLRNQLISQDNTTVDIETIPQLVNSWMCSIEGHKLWQEMMDFPSYELVYGFILENYHYISSATRHISPAITACPDPMIRLSLLKYLDEELDHGKLLQTELERSSISLPINYCRPLSTTVAFVGYLQNIARSDWKAYCIALAFLQSSLTHRHSLFYQAVTDKVAGVSTLLEAMYHHDQIDQDLGYDQDAELSLMTLITRHEITRENLAQASLIPQLAWSFLDGILSHYKLGLCAVKQRIAWVYNSNTSNTVPLRDCL
jgi:pyrroloquinoline quinone (PQQ) biosynthesis protein C